MEYCQASKSDIDFDFDDDSVDVSIATDASSVASSQPRRRGIRGVARQFDQSVGLQQQEEDEGDVDFLGGIVGDDTEGASDASLRSDNDEDEFVPTSTGEGKRSRISSVDSDDFGPPIVVPLKTGSDHSGGDNENLRIEPGSRSSRGSRRSSRTGSFTRRLPVRTKSGEGMGSSTHSAASGRRRPPVRTKSGNAIRDDTSNASNEVDATSSHRRKPPARTKSSDRDGLRRRPPQRTKSGSTLRSNEGDGSEVGEEYEAQLPDDGSFGVPPSPGGRLLGQGDKYREEALKRNSARRQRSCDNLALMRQATRNIPSRSQSGVVGGISNGRRRGASRTLSTDGGGEGMADLASPGRKPLRRKAPPRTKSGGLLQAPPLET